VNAPPTGRLSATDRVIEKPRWSAKTITIGGAVLVAIALTVAMLVGTRASTMTVDPDRITVSTVRNGQFVEYIPILGTVEPIKTVYLDAVEGGQVQEIFVDDGQPIEKGEMILRLSNAALQKDSISTESRLLENINTLRNTRINLAEKELLLKQEYLDNDYRISQLEKQHARYSKMLKESNAALSEVEFEQIVDELEYRREKREILKARIAQEKTLREQQLAQIDETIAQVNHNLQVVTETLDNLNVRAPISGQLSTLKVELGQSIRQGENIGQIDQLHALKVRGEVDQHYISKVALGQLGYFTFDGKRHELRIEKIYTEVENEVFDVDMAFTSAKPEGLKRGQSIQIDLSLSGAVDCRVIAKGGFYRSTGGRWIFRVADDGTHATRANIRVGRQNPRHLELLDGLEVGDVVITSSYDGFANVEQLEFSQPLNLESVD
jgi:HlyD family secretion protein